MPELSSSFRAVSATSDGKPYKAGPVSNCITTNVILKNHNVSLAK